MTTVKVKEISKVKFNNTYETEDKRYETNKSLIKVIKYCIKNGFSFKVGFNDCTLINNKKYYIFYNLARRRRCNFLIK